MHVFSSGAGLWAFWRQTQGGMERDTERKGRRAPFSRLRLHFSASVSGLEEVQLLSLRHERQICPSSFVRSHLLADQCSPAHLRTGSGGSPRATFRSSFSTICVPLSHGTQGNGWVCANASKIGHYGRLLPSLRAGGVLSYLQIFESCIK